MAPRLWKRRNQAEQIAGFGLVVDPLRVLAGNRSLVLLLTAFAGVTVAEWTYVTALAIEAFRLHGSIAVGLVGVRLFFAAASSLFSLPYVERHPGGHVLTAVAAARTAIVALSAVLARGNEGSFAPLLALVAIDALISAMYRPAQSALLPQLARTPTELAATTAAISTVKTVSQGLGATAGGLLMVVVTPRAIFAGTCVLFFAAALTTVRFREPQSSRDKRPKSGVRDIAHDTLGVLRHAHVAGIVLVSGLRTFVRGMWLASAVIASLRLLHAGSAGVGLLGFAAGLGALLAVPISASLIGRLRLGTPAAIALSTCGIPLGLIAGLPVLVVALVLVVAWGVGMAVADVATMSLLLRMLPSPLLPRATAWIESSKLALEGFGALVAPLLIGAIGVRATLVVAGLPLPLVVFAGWSVLHRADKTATERNLVRSLLHNAPCLAPLDLVALDSLVSRVEYLSVPPRFDIIEQGDEGDRFYVVEAGSADVLMDGFLVGQVEAGASFGEKALLRDVKRTATVRSREQMQLLALSREDFLTALTGQELSGSTKNPPQMLDSSSTWNRRERMTMLSGVSLLSHLESIALVDLADRSMIERWQQGVFIIRQGELGDRFFVLLEGRAQVLADGVVVNELFPGDQFGEIALLHDVARRADVITISDATTLSLGRDDFVAAVRSRLALG